jgi:hypothetical protein
MNLFISYIITVFILSAAHGDILHFKDGRKLEGEVKQEGDAISIKTRFGSFSFKKSEVARIEKAKTPTEEYKTRAGILEEGDLAGHFSLALWCKSKRLNRELKRELELGLVMN